MAATLDRAFTGTRFSSYLRRARRLREARSKREFPVLDAGGVVEMVAAGALMQHE
jgi:hypothetical protein